MSKIIGGLAGFLLREELREKGVIAAGNSARRTPNLLLRRFFLDYHFQMRGHIPVQFDRHRKLTQSLERLM